MIINEDPRKFFYIDNEGKEVNVVFKMHSLFISKPMQGYTSVAIPQFEDQMLADAISRFTIADPSASCYFGPYLLKKLTGEPHILREAPRVFRGILNNNSNFALEIKSYDRRAPTVNLYSVEYKLKNYAQNGFLWDLIRGIGETEICTTLAIILLSKHIYDFLEPC